MRFIDRINQAINAATMGFAHMRDYYKANHRLLEKDGEVLSLRLERERLLLEMDRKESARRDAAWSEREVEREKPAPASWDELANVMEMIHRQATNIDKALEKLSKRELHPGSTIVDPATPPKT